MSRLETRYIEVWQVCALWAGRYPIPIKEHQFPSQRAGASSRSELAKMAVKRRQRALEEGDPLMGSEVHDILHGGVNLLEIETFRGIFERLNALLQNIQPSKPA